MYNYSTALQFYSKFPDQDIVLRVGLTKPPTMSIQPAGISGLLPGNIEVYARANNTLSYAFTLGVVSVYLQSRHFKTIYYS